jgi:hypothetical protein
MAGVFQPLPSIFQLGNSLLIASFHMIAEWGVRFDLYALAFFLIGSGKSISVQLGVHP